jgi:hypothetical protein
MLKVNLSIILIMFIFQFSLAQNEAYNAFKIADEKVKEEPENYLAPVKALENIAFDSTDNMAKNMIAQALQRRVIMINEE